MWEGGEKEKKKRIKKNNGHNFSKFAENHKTIDSRNSIKQKQVNSHQGIL